MKLSVRQLEIFRLFARTKSVSETAKLLRISQPAISQTLKDLERQLGFALFVRAGNRSRLTMEAGALLPEIERLFSQMVALRGRAEELKDAKAGFLSIAAIPTLGTAIIPEAIAGFRTGRAEVKVRVEIHTASEVVRQVRQEYADLGFAFLPIEEAGIAVHPLIETEIACLMPRTHALAGRSVLTFGDLAEEVVIVQGAQTPPGFVLRESLARRVDRLQIIDTNQSAAALHLARVGLGIALTHPLVLSANLQGEMMAIKLQPSIKLTLAMIYSRSKPVSRLVMNFSSKLREIVKSYCVEMQDRHLVCSPLV